jgi:cellulase/cellobiase CelA1
LQQNIRKFLLKTGNDPGAIRISSKALGRLADWVDWQTPVLGSTPSSPPPSSPPPSSPPPSSPPPSSPPPSSPPPVSGCTASASVNAWTGGFVVTVRVTAGSSAINGWNVRLTLPAGAAVTNTWNAAAGGTSGSVQFSNVAYNGRLSAAQSTEFGFQGAGAPGSLTPTCTAT